MRRIAGIGDAGGGPSTSAASKWDRSDAHRVADETLPALILLGFSPDVPLSSELLLAQTVGEFLALLFGCIKIGRQRQTLPSTNIRPPIALISRPSRFPSFFTLHRLAASEVGKS